MAIARSHPMIVTARMTIHSCLALNILFDFRLLITFRLSLLVGNILDFRFHVIINLSDIEAVGALVIPVVVIAIPVFGRFFVTSTFAEPFNKLVHAKPYRLLGQSLCKSCSGFHIGILVGVFVVM